MRASVSIPRPARRRAHGRRTSSCGAARRPWALSAPGPSAGACKPAPSLGLPGRRRACRRCLRVPGSCSRRRCLARTRSRLAPRRSRRRRRCSRRRPGPRHCRCRLVCRRPPSPPPRMKTPGFMPGIAGTFEIGAVRAMAGEYRSKRPRRTSRSSRVRRGLIRFLLGGRRCLLPPPGAPRPRRPRLAAGGPADRLERPRRSPHPRR